MNRIEPIEYRITLEPDLTRFRFKGRVEIDFKAHDPVESLRLNILDLEIKNCRIETESGVETCPFLLNPEKEDMKVRLPTRRTGDIHLSIEYDGEINDKMAGFYRSGYTKDGQERFMAVTQFQERDARRAFPCMDHPEKKAVFYITMVLDQDLTAVSNSSVTRETKLENGKKRVEFNPTPKMSTYLVFFSLAEFQMAIDETDKRVRALTTPGMLENAGFGLAFGRKALRFCEDYYGIPYPLPKMDLIAIPDFAFGAMENWGAITFRENLLLHFPGLTSRAGEERICEVIAHEIAHQWFGNLVTPSDWKYLWLNESFATFFGYGVVDHYYPAWGVWYQFLNEQTNAALNRDGLHETFAIEMPGRENLAINTSTAPIIYCKGGSVLRQILGYIGTDNFKNGVHHFLKTHEYGNASSHHLWEAFEEVSKEPVSRLMESWIEQPGYPVVEVAKDANQLVLTQQRFTYLANRSDQEWMIPLNIDLFSGEEKTETLKTLLDRKTCRLDIPEDVTAYKVNAAQTGFYRVRYLNPDDLNEVGEMILKKRLPPEDRWGIQNDIYAFVRQGKVELDQYIDFLKFYDREDEYLPMGSIADNLHHAYLIMGEKQKKKIAETGVRLLEKALESIGWEPTSEEPHTISILRDQILWQGGLFGSGKANDFAAGKFQQLRDGENIAPDIMKGVLQVGALNWDEDGIDWFLKRLLSSRSEHERMNILVSIGCFSHTPSIRKALEYVIEHVPPRNKFVPVVAMCANPHATGHIWTWYQEHLTDLEALHPMLYERIITAIIPVFGNRQPQKVKGFFRRYMDQHPQYEESIKLAMEKLEINLGMSGQAD